MRNLATFLMVVVLTGAGPLAGTKEELVRLQSDVLQLQNQIRLLQKSFDESNGIVKSLLEQLNDQIARSNAVIEGFSSALQSQKADTATISRQVREEIQTLSVKLDDTNNRIAGLHQKMEENQLKIGSLRAVPSAETPGGVIEPDQVYQAAYNDYLMNNLDLAIRGFQDFLAEYPQSEYADNALYYLAFSYSTQGRFEDAVRVFDQLINLYPQGDKTAAAFFKKGLALQSIQKHSEAIEAFQQLQTLFPEAPEAALAGQELQKLGITAGGR